MSSKSVSSLMSTAWAPHELHLLQAELEAMDIWKGGDIAWREGIGNGVGVKVLGWG